MPAPPAYLDECIDFPLVEALRLRGFDLLTAQEAATLRATDEDQLSYAARIGRPIVTYNRLDFIRAHQQCVAHGREHAGILLLPQKPPLSRRVLRVALMLDRLADVEHGSRLFTWGMLQQELLRGLRVPGYIGEEVRHALGWT